MKKYTLTLLQKMTFNRLKLLAGLFLCTQISCESLVTDLDPDKIPQNVEKLVINAYLSPQDTLLIVKAHYSDKIFKTTSLTNNGGTFGQTENIAKDAKIEISDGSQKIDLIFNAAEGVYLAKAKDFKIKEGKTYYLKAIDIKNKVYTAETTVPRKIDFEVIKVEEIDNTPNFNKLYNISIQFKAPALSYFRWGKWDETETESFNESGQKTLIKAKSWYGVYTANSDVIEKNLVETTAKDYFFSNSKVISRQIRFLRVDKNYYDYGVSVNNNNDIENPFAEPTLIKSNIKNGYGCFASYVEVVKTYKIN
jgi:hypothetical protein